MAEVRESMARWRERLGRAPAATWRRAAERRRRATDEGGTAGSGGDD